ncbi:hypothetical protein [Endozoicomonas sp. ONNA1]|uniref:hypothetical protein n=1 Tax=Endozoicomonas sp. ONNA1 TaxID=2828740 RepID=UPI002148272D|nr:hypothetical protein [Endozoicomonas sp. ONNA1]
MISLFDKHLAKINECNVLLAKNREKPLKSREAIITFNKDEIDDYNKATKALIKSVLEDFNKLNPKDKLDLKPLNEIVEKMAIEMEV